MTVFRIVGFGAVLVTAAVMVTGMVAAGERPTMSQVLEDSTDDDWRKPDDAYTVYMKIPGGTVILEMAPEFAPNVIENIRKLSASGFFDGTAIMRSQENYVVQWGDPLSETDEARSHGNAAANIEAEFYRAADGLDFIAIDSRDAYADQVGFVNGFPAGKDSDGERAWLTHCYGMVGVGRGMATDSGNGADLYVVTGHSPRHLDRNVVLVGRVLVGMELLTTLRRGTGPLGFYENAEQQVPIESMRFASDLPEDQHVDLRVLRTDTETFSDLVESRRYRAEEWFVDPTGRIGLCNVPIPVRTSQ